MDTHAPERSDAAPAQQDAFAYWAFISYSHADEQWARWLHRGLETYKVPKAIVGTATTNGAARPPRLFPLFRDRDELSSASSLSARIQDALNASRNLIVICSPRAVASHWVGEEIRTFQHLGRADRVFCLIVDGEPDALQKPRADAAPCFPEALRQSVADGTVSALETEPLAADARPDRDGKRNALLKLAAGILDVGFDTLKQRDHERRIRQFTIAGAVLSAAVLTLAALAYYAFVQKGVAEREARAARAALSGQIASHAQISLAAFPQRSLLLAVQALRTTADKQEDIVPGAREAILRALAVTGGEIFGGDDDSPIAAVAVSPNGRWVATAAENGSGVRLWDRQAAQRGASKRELRGAAGPLAISANGRWLVSAGREGAAARVWDLTAQDPNSASRPLDGATGPFVFTRDDRWLATGGLDRSVRLWAMTPSPSSASAVLASQSGSTVVLAASPDSHWLVTAGWNPSIRPGIDTARLWDLTAAQPEATGVELKGHTSSISEVAFSPDGRWLATGSQETGTGRIFRSDTRVRLWDLKAPGLPAVDLNAHDGPITALTISADSRLLVSGSADGTARVWTLTDPKAPPQSLAVSGSATELQGVAVVSHTDSSATIATIEGGFDRRTMSQTAALARTWRFDANSKSFVPMLVASDGKPVAVSMFAASRDGRRLLLAEGGRAFVLDLGDTSQVPLLTLSGHEGEVASAAFTLEGDQVITGSADRTARLWRLDPILPAANPIVVAADYSRRYALSPDGRWLLTLRGGHDADGLLWNMERTADTVDPIVLRGHAESITTFAFSADSGRLATGSRDATVRIWDLRTRPQRRVRRAARARDERLIAGVQQGRWPAGNGRR
jgi:WD40 repeat protein